MKPRHAPLLLLVLALTSLPVRAEKADSAKPMNIEADALRYDDANQSSTFTGRVVVTKGTIVMRGARLEARQDESGHQFGTLIAEPGQRAFFRQKREGVDEFIEGEGERIEYDGRADTVRFIRRGELRRYRGTTLVDQITGQLIVYDNTTEIFTVDGSVNGASPGAAAASGGRVRAMLSPREPAPVPAGRSARPAASQPAPALRPSPALEGSRP